MVDLLEMYIVVYFDQQIVPLHTVCWLKSSFFGVLISLQSIVQSIHLIVDQFISR